MRSISLISLFTFACSNEVPPDRVSEVSTESPSEPEPEPSPADDDDQGPATGGDEESSESTSVEPEEEVPVDADGDGFTDDIDCDDHDPRVAPGADEICDGLDNDCDGVIDPNTALDVRAWYRDSDSDGFGDPGESVSSCEDPGPAWVANNEDCDDSSGLTHPAAAEVCDGIDNDCDAVVDPASSEDAPTWFVDTDADGFGAADEHIRSCTEPDGSWSSGSTDCDDTDDRIHPGAEEFCDDIDSDCDGVEADAIGTWYGVAEAPVDATPELAAGFFRRTEMGTLKLCDGTWTARLEFEVDGISSSLGTSLIEIQGLGDAVLDGGDDGRLITVGGGISALEISDVTLQHGEADEGGAIHAESLDLSLNRVAITDSSASGRGGAIFLQEGSIELDEVDIWRNTSSGHGAHGAGIYLASGVIDGSAVSLRYNTGSGMASGGAVYVVSGSVTLDDSSIVGNEASYKGGAIAILDGDLTLTDSEMEDNTASLGGGAYVAGFVDLSATLVDGNQANFGGAVYLAEADFSEGLACSEGGDDQAGFANNTASVSGGAVYVSSYFGVEVQSFGCDWGTGGSDNAPQDIRFQLADIDAGMNATFDCENYTCIGDALLEVEY